MIYGAARKIAVVLLLHLLPLFCLSQIKNVSDTGLCASVVLGREGGEDKKNFV